MELNERMLELRWSLGTCGQSGCTDPECVCALCALPLGIREDDPTHDPECDECERCKDNVPIILFDDKKGQAALHEDCFNKLLLKK